MINENEIQIGNWFEHLPEWSYRNEELKSFQFQWTSYDWYNYCECCLSLDCIRPIKITLQILEKCGFEFDKDHPYTENSFGVSLESQDLHFYYTSECLHFIGREIRFLHQLQNLIFSITGHNIQHNI
jgi:hypothetical protein